MKNLEKVIKIMGTLSDVDQEILVGFKLSCSENVHAARKSSELRFTDLSSQEKMKVLYFLEADEISRADLYSISSVARCELAKELILKDYEEQAK